MSGLVQWSVHFKLNCHNFKCIYLKIRTCIIIQWRPWWLLYRLLEFPMWAGQLPLRLPLYVSKPQLNYVMLFRRRPGSCAVVKKSKKGPSFLLELAPSCASGFHLQTCLSSDAILFPLAMVGNHGHRYCHCTRFIVPIDHLFPVSTSLVST